jgi:hypothetical protein
MCDVYERSMLNIAASAARNGQERCFRSRIPATVELYKLPIRTDKAGQRVYHCVDWHVGKTS